MKDIGTTIISIAIVLVAVAASFFIGRWTKRPEVVNVEVVTTDTLTVRDTVRIEKPIYIRERVVDTMFVAVTEFQMIHDTLFMALPREQKEYSDTTYHAWVSGYQPALDSIVVNQLTKYVTTTITMPEKKKRWAIGATAGYGATLDDKRVVLSPYIGIGITYVLFSF